LTPHTSTAYRLELPRYDLEPKPRRLVWDTLRGNSRPGHWSKRHRAVKRVITDVVWLAKAAKIPAGQHIAVRLTWAPGRRVRADVDNLAALQKVMCDALARGRRDLPGLHLVPDDTPDHMTKHMPVIAYPPAEAGLWLDVEVTA
jgi:crossover junction endodeoxyribonuclease RusA